MGEEWLLEEGEANNKQVSFTSTQQLNVPSPKLNLETDIMASTKEIAPQLKREGREKEERKWSDASSCFANLDATGR